MKSRTVPGLIALAVVGAAAAALSLQSQSISAVSTAGSDEQAAIASSLPKPDLACLLPGNKVNLQCLLAVDPDVKRIRREEARLEEQALARANSGDLDPLHQVRTLGELEIFDPSLAVNNNLQCSFCHDPAAGYANGVTAFSLLTGGSNPGSVPITVHGAYPNNRIAKRNPQSYAYAAYFSPLRYNQSQQDFYGGNFWDGRATGYKLQNPAAEQAQDPPTDPDEMGNPDAACVVWKLSEGKYKNIFEQVFGEGSLDIEWPSDIARVCAIPAGAAAHNGNQTPVVLSPAERTRVNQAFGEFGQSIAAYEASPKVSGFSSKFDYFLAGTANLSKTEQAGYNLFRGKAKCNTCHLDGRSNIAGGASDSGAPTDVAPLFTDQTFSNLGLPKNPRLPFYHETQPDQFGYTPNPLGFGFVDEGLGLFLDGFYGAPPNLSWGKHLPKFEGKFQTSTLRQIGQYPYPGFVKAFMHNGYLTSLKQVVHFYNTRDVYPFPVQSGHCPAGTKEKINCWPMPEDPNNMDRTIGDLGLSDSEEDQLVAFMLTLNDGFEPKQ